MTLRVSRRSIGAAATSAMGLAITQRVRAQVSSPDQVATLPQPTGPTLLTISGKIRVTNDGNMAVFDRSMLEGLGTATVTTNTPWYDGPVRFDGVPMAKLMEVVGAEGQSLTAVALNDYSTDIPIADFVRFGVLLATKKGGAPMRVSDRGPLFIIYPYDSDSELRSRVYYSRSAWSVAQLIVR